MKYQIFYTNSARQDLKNIYRYISEDLVEPEIAAKLTDKISLLIRPGVQKLPYVSHPTLLS